MADQDGVAGAVFDVLHRAESGSGPCLGPGVGVGHVAAVAPQGGTARRSEGRRPGLGGGGSSVHRFGLEAPGPAGELAAELLDLRPLSPSLPMPS